MKRQTPYVEIGPYHIRLAPGSQIPKYKNSFHLYDTALAKIARVMKAKYPTLHAIDVGANVGDTAALIRESDEIPVLCIEGDPSLFPLLEENVARLGPEVKIERSFLGPDGLGINLGSARDLGNNACLVEAVDEEGATNLRSLRAILADHPEFGNSKLLKTDTEGFDFTILKQSIDFIRESKPAIFFEYDPTFHSDEPQAGLEIIEELTSADYSDFIYYDNFGNFLLHAEASNRTIFADLDRYLASNRRHGVAVYYFDICALHQEDAELAIEIKSLTQR
jgi:FkbM family methyltransferase